MMNGFGRSAFMATTAIVCVAAASPALAQSRTFDVPAQAAATGIAELGRQADIQIVAARRNTQGKQTNAVQGEMTIEQALAALLKGTGLVVQRTGPQTYSVVSEAGTETETSAVRDDVIIVTAQKRVESIQDVPIAMTALSMEDLNDQKIEGGPDIMRAVPNLTFSKSNFTSYNISIRGIGTKAISATTDPGVAVSFNNTGLIHNRFFEQEFFDMERVEILRGPQGTLYGRNATGGVVNLITAKPDLGGFEGNIKAEVGNYDSRRIVGMLNIPLASDVLGLRVAGSMTQRDGYDFNAVTKNRINGRDLWSLRTTVAFEPAPWLRANVIWERFREDDNRSRTGKQLCHRDGSPDVIGSTPTREPPDPTNAFYADVQEARAAMFSTGCKAGSLYDDAAFGTPNGLALANVFGLLAVQDGFGTFVNQLPDGGKAFLINPLADPYGGMMQSRDLREISSVRDPRYRAESDILAINLELDLSENLSLFSQTAWNWDDVYSFQDYNRFNTVPIFVDTSNWVDSSGNPSRWRDMAPGGMFCDPQIGCTDRLAVFDVSTADSEQFTQEVRLQSDFAGPFNFSIGGNYTRFETQNDYYVMSNVFTAIAMLPPFNGTGTQDLCGRIGWGNISGEPYPVRDSFCPYIDPNPVEDIDGDGHNYFRSSNPYELESWAAFGEGYYNISPDLKVTAGLRYTRDKKTFTVVPSQLLLAPTFEAGGYVGTGHPASGEINRKWGEFTGRIGLDWKPDLGFTDDSLLYAFYSRGYKAGGINPPTPGYAEMQQLVDLGFITQQIADNYTAFGVAPILELTAVNYGPTFEPEFVNAFEIGSKNVLMGGRLTLNAAAFFYDYKNYQVSQIRDRTAVNENFDSKVWGAELTAQFEPVDNLRFNANLGYLRTRIGTGEQSIDPMNRTLGNPDYLVTKPWVQLPSNCVVPVHIAEAWLNTQQGISGSWKFCGGVGGILGATGRTVVDPLTGAPYDPDNYGLNGGAGFNSDLGGNELPNSPRWTANLGAEYTIPFGNDWSATVRGDGYWQAKSWARVYNLDPYDRLRDWTNFNLTVRVNGPEDLTIEAYVKNIFNSTPITDAFLNSDDSGLTTNVFMLDPRIIGFSIAKAF